LEGEDCRSGSYPIIAGSVIVWSWLHFWKFYGLRCWFSINYCTGTVKLSPNILLISSTFIS
jgi:hypothetical protein